MDRMTGLTYPDGKTIAYQYNQLGQLKEVPGYIDTPPVYNENGLLKTLTAANGVQTSYNYDNNSRLVNLNYRNTNESIKQYALGYDNANNIIAKNQSSYVYDELNQLVFANLYGNFEIDVKKKTQTIGAKEDDFTGEEELSFNTGDVELKLDYAAMSIGVDLGAVYDVSKLEIYPDAAGHRLKAKTLEVYAASDNYDNAFTKTTEWVLNERKDGVLEVLLRQPIKGRYIKLHCLYDDRDEEEQPVDKSTVKNGKDKILKVYYMIDWRKENFTYDEKGNRVTSGVTLEDTTTKAYTYYQNSDGTATTDRLQSDGKYGYKWDANGNLTAKGSSYTIVTDELIFDNNEGEYWDYEYDLLNRLTSVAKSEAGTVNKQLAAEYTYDANNLRIKKTSSTQGDTWYVFSAGGSVLCKETSEEKEQYIYVMGNLFAMKSSKPDETDEQVYFYVVNHLGTTEMVTDESGKVVWQDELSPFGESSGEIGIVHMQAKFTGKDLDEETGLYYFNARWMSPELGRFISVDPMRDGVNWYIFTVNNPIYYIDPTGLLTVNQDNNSVTFDDENDTLHEGAIDAGYEDSDDNQAWEKVLKEGTFIDESGQLIDNEEIKKWFNDDGTWSDYAKTNKKSLIGITMASKDNKIVLLMRGHSATNAGTTNETDEITKLTPELKNALEAKGLFVVIDPQVNYPKDKFNLDDRCDYIKKYEKKFAAMIEIHFNAFIVTKNETRRGGDVNYPPTKEQNPSSYALANNIYNAIINNSYIKKSGYTFNINGIDYQVQGNQEGHRHNVPAVLIEAGWWANTPDMTLFHDDDFLDEWTKAVAEGVADSVN